MLKTGKKQIDTKRTIGDIPYVEAKSSFSIALDAISPTLERMERNADATASANYFQDFQIKTRDQFLKFSLDEQLKNNPADMKAAVDTYSKTLLEKIPAVYKIQANAMLSSSSSVLVNGAANNRFKLDEAKFEFDNAEIYNNLNTNAEYSHSVAADNPDTNAAKGAVNDATVKAMLFLNNQAHEDFEMLVKPGSKESRSDKAHMLRITNGTKALHITNGFNMMKTMNEIDAYNYINLLIDNKNPTPITSEEIANNPILEIYNNQMNDDDTRKEITDAIWNQYSNWRGKKLKANEVNAKFNFEKETEIGNGLHFGNFIEGANSNLSKYISENYNGVSAANVKTITKHINKIYDIQSHVSSMKNGVIPTGLSEDKKEEAFQHILFEHGVAKSPNEIMDVTDMNFIKVKNIFEQQGSIPKSWTNYFNTSTGNLEQESSMMAFKKKLEFYNQISGEFGGWHTNIDTNSFLYHMSTNDALSMSDGEIVDLAKKWNVRDKKEISESVNTQINLDVKEFHKNIDLALDGNETFLKAIFMPFRESVSRDLSFSTIMGDGNKYSKVLFEDSFHWFASNPFEDMQPTVKADFIAKVTNELKFMAADSNVDISNKDVISRATYSALNKLLKANYTPSKYTKKAVNNMDKGILFDSHDYSLTKHGIEHEFGLGDSAIAMSIMPTFVAWHNSQSAEDKANGLFGIDKNGKKISFDDLAAKIKDGSVLPIFEPTGQMIDGKMSYSVSVSNGQGGFIKITEPGEFFQPDGWQNVDQEDAPSTKDNLLKVLAKENISTMDKILGEFKPTDSSSKYLMHKFADAGEKGLISLANWSWMMDLPLLNDVPNEVKPFKMLFNLLGKDVPDLDERMNEIAINNKKIADLKTYSDGINEDTILNDKSKALESIYPPHKQPHTSYQNGMMFGHYASTNYNNTSLPLTQRTNNLLGLEKTENDNSLDLVAENNTAVFGHPKDSVKASVMKIISMSTIVPGNKKILNDEPTIEELLSSFNAKDKNLYLNALKNTDILPETLVNFQDTNQISKIIKFMIKSKMNTSVAPGETSAFDTYYPAGNLMIDIYINEGVSEAYETFAGKWGKN